MLYLNPPYFMYKGVTVLCDNNDPYQFYYFPNRPHLAVDDGHPAVRLLVYKANLDELKPEEEAVAGFFYFDTTLAWPEETLKKVAQKIQEAHDLDRLPTLTPLLFKAGNVRLIFLDKTTPLPQPPGGTTPPTDPPIDTDASERWVIKLESSGVPSLYGDNRAIFSAVLTKEATQLILNSFDGFIPAGVVYDLTFVGMQRAFNVKVSADWEQVYHFLDEKMSMDLFFFQSEIEDITQQMFDQKIIKIEGALEGVEEEGMENEFNAVRKELQEFVLDQFFKPMPLPDKQDTEDSVTDQIVDFARDLRTLGFPSCGYSRRQVDINEVRSLHIDYSVARAVERKIAPQAHISLFFEDFNLTRDEVVTVVNGADDFWRTTDFNVSANADFEKDGIFGIDVDIAYGDDLNAGSDGMPSTSWAGLLTKDSPAFKKSAWYDPNSGNAFAYRYQTFFSSTAIPGEQLQLKSDWRTDSGSVLVITPEELYRKRHIEFQLAKNYPEDLMGQVQLEMRYIDPDTNWTYQDSAILDSTNPKASFTFRTRPLAPPSIAYQCNYAQGEVPLQTDWQSTDSDLVLVVDPRKNLFKVNILVAGDRSKIQELILNFRYEDLTDGHVETKLLRLNSSNINDPHEWVFAPSDPKQHRYSYSQLLIDTDGNLVETGVVEEEKGTLPIGVIYAKRWEVRPSLIGPALSENGLEKIKLQLHYEDETNEVVSDKEMLFIQPGNGEPWTLQLKDPSARFYTYRVSYVFQNGFEKKVGPISSNDTFLTISSVPPL